MRTILKVCALLIATTISTTVAFAAEKHYVDASTLTIINKAHNDGLPFSRVDISKFDIPEFAKKGLSNSTGLAEVFSTNSRNISARWTTVTKRASTNMTPILKRWVHFGYYITIWLSSLIMRRHGISFLIVS